jgi:hypothetical protein
MLNKIKKIVIKRLMIYYGFKVKFQGYVEFPETFVD